MISAVGVSRNRISILAPLYELDAEPLPGDAAILQS